MAGIAEPLAGALLVCCGPNRSGNYLALGSGLFASRFLMGMGLSGHALQEENPSWGQVQAGRSSITSSFSVSPWRPIPNSRGSWRSTASSA